MTIERLARNYGEFRDADEQLQDSEKKLRNQVNYLNTLIDNMNEMFFTYDAQAKITFVNKKAWEVLGYRPEAMIGRDMLEFVPKKEKAVIRNAIQARLAKGVSASYKTYFEHKDGSQRCVKLSSSPIIEDGEIAGGMVLAEDVTERKMAEEQFLTAHQQLQDIIDFLPDATFVIDKDKKIIAWNRAIEEFSGFSKREVIGKGDYAYAIPFYGEPRPILIDLVGREIPETAARYEHFKRQGNAIFGQIYVPFIRKKRGAYLWGIAAPLYDSRGNWNGAVESMRDITDRKELEEQLKYLSLHDPLVGLYNRAYFEQEMCRLEKGRSTTVGIIVCDLDGLKLINDTLGHDTGDGMLMAAAKIIRRVFRESDVVARIGGDEFVVLLPDTDRRTVEKAYHRIREAINAYNEVNPELPLSLSIGFAVGHNNEKSMAALFEQADDNMYREKLHRKQSQRSAIVSAMMKAMEARDFITEGHAARMQKLVVKLGNHVGMDNRQISDLRLLTQFHDIGKVGIPDRILFKPGPLDPGELEEMKRHCEIGYGIALAAPDLAPIADFILKHHEWWNGQGYPFGLQREEIPLECRVLAIADAYDAITSDRPYRKARSSEAALVELARCAGTQFEPRLVESFIEILGNN
ncbi:MAG: PAS domain S-box protein [Heliobacteriaceae bacterium]|nr:PAS domain S-box protein [Heliobacteriaceae bacterium]